MHCSMNATQTKQPHLIYKTTNIYFLDTKFSMKKTNVGKILKL